ncbi:MAG: DUF4410 domain-containing protein [Desulfobacteraceae bacterium]|nr:MAG: DUF4410 domain-containing protein [Desulfobacteraceae bacterium]
MKRLMLIGLIIVLGVVAGCHSRTDAPKVKNEIKQEKMAKAEKMPAEVSAGKDTKISVMMDVGDDSLALEKIEQRERLNDWMGRDLVAMFKKAGYEAALIENSGQSKKGTYLLKVTILKYNAGSKAARIVVGFGAVSVGLDTKYELFAPEGNRILSDEHGVGSSLDWTSCARKLNKQTVDAVKKKLGR